MPSSEPSTRCRTRTSSGRSTSSSKTKRRKGAPSIPMETFRNWSLQSGKNRSEVNEAGWPTFRVFLVGSHAEAAPRGMHQNGVYWCYMPLAKRSHAKSARLKHVRRSDNLPPKIAKHAATLARESDLHHNRALAELIEQGSE